MFEHRSPGRSSRRLSLLVAGAIALLGGCNKDTPAAVAAPEPPAEPTMTKSFAGSIGQQGISCHNFTLSESGKMILSLKELLPLQTLTVGLNIGQPDAAGVCIALAQDSSVKLFDMMLSIGTGGQEYCGCVLDVGNIFAGQTVDYVLQVDHT